MDPAKQITTVLNLRDVGVTVNSFLGRKLMREGLLYRSARPDEASAADRDRITDELGVKSIIDLRTDTEHLKAAQERALVSKKPMDRKQDLDAVRIPGVRYHDVKLTGGAYEKYLLRQLPFLSLIYFLMLFIFGYRMEAIAIIGRKVMMPMGLVGMGLTTLDQSGPEYAAVLGTYIEPGGLPSLVHCTQGKDRTGLVIALVLLILGVPVAAIEHDYDLSDGALVLDREERLAEIRSIGLTEDWMRTSKEMIPMTVAHLDTYGGLDKYLDSIGFSEPQRQQLRDLLLY